MLFIGVGFLPLANRLFRNFEDGGWLFSKTLGLFLSGWLFWVFCVAGLVSFVQSAVLVFLLILFCAMYLGYASRLPLQKRKTNRGRIVGTRTFSDEAGENGTEENDGDEGSAHAEKDPSEYRFGALEGLFRSKDSRRLIIAEELMFLAIFGIAFYVIGFNPAAYGTEKFMDYAFLTAMNRSTVMPFEDMWYSGSAINYYYGGQYMASFLMKMTGVAPGYAYNLMRALLTSGSFVLPFSLVYQLSRDRGSADISLGAGLLGGLATAFCGNMHYVIYALILPVIHPDTPGYWFPDATRYIGYNPDIPDKTIHEFPAYSSVLGDLHAHYINVIFVITAAALVYAWAQCQDPRRPKRFPLLDAHLVIIGIMTGAFRWTNYWDFPIYYVVCGSVIFFVNLRIYSDSVKKFIAVMLGEAVMIFAAGYIAALPFKLKFDMISSEVHRTHSHSPLIQLMVLWGLPAFCLLIYVIRLLTEYLAMRKSTPRLLWKARRMALPDLTVLMFGLCAAGLVFLPEVIYVKDIYGGEHYRANTMFKLTYQAFILFAMCMAYILVRMITERVIILKILGIAGAALLILTGGYTIRATRSWFGEDLRPSARVSSDASVYLSQDFREDKDAIDWINENIEGNPVILEAAGDSYTEYGRVSVSTGCPTIEGWYVHEWLWRDDPDDLNVRRADIETVYTSEDPETARMVADLYDVSYIFVGSCEREAFPDLNVRTLTSIGEVVYGSEDGTFIVKVRSFS